MTWKINGHEKNHEFVFIVFSTTDVTYVTTKKQPLPPVSDLQQTSDAHTPS